MTSCLRGPCSGTRRERSAIVVTSHSSKALVPGEFLLTTADFRRIAEMVHGDAGIDLVENKATLVYSRLAKRLRLLNLYNFQDYCELVASAEGVEERARMLAALTTNVTRFFREPHHFEDLARSVITPLIAHARAGGRVRLWSAACSNGMEPYSMALTLLELMPDAAEHDIRILATDIDPNMIAHGAAGVYDRAAIEPIPHPLREAWMVPSVRGPRMVGSGPDTTWSVGPELRRLVVFRELNLIGRWPMAGTFQAIFCRNVVIYFNDETQARVWDRLLPYLEDSGRLYIGHSERITGSAAAALEVAGITTYRKPPPA